jgi:glycosyltransferase involved in cell wall biosynthesis
MRITLAICAIVRNEGPYIREWITFHRLVGVQEVFLYDDGSDDDTVDIARSCGACVMPWGPDVDHGPFVCPEPCEYNTPQLAAFNHFTWLYRDQVEWCAFIDVDEYLFHRECDTLLPVLINYPTVPGLWVEWSMFGDSGHIYRPDMLTIEAYTRRAAHWTRYGGTGKVVARMTAIQYWGPHGSHWPRWLQGHASCCDSENNVRLNHYYTRSLSEWRAKISRSDRTVLSPRVAKGDYAAFDQHRTLNQIEDVSITRFVERLRLLMGGRP